MAVALQDLETMRALSLARRQKYRAERFAWAVGYPRLFYSAEQMRALEPGGPTRGISLGSGAAFRLDPCPDAPSALGQRARR